MQLRSGLIKLGPTQYRPIVKLRGASTARSLTADRLQCLIPYTDELETIFSEAGSGDQNRGIRKSRGIHGIPNACRIQRTQMDLRAQDAQVREKDINQIDIKHAIDRENVINREILNDRKNRIAEGYQIYGSNQIDEDNRMNEDDQMHGEVPMYFQNTQVIDNDRIDANFINDIGIPDMEIDEYFINDIMSDNELMDTIIIDDILDPTGVQMGYPQVVGNNQNMLINQFNRSNVDTQQATRRSSFWTNMANVLKRWSRLA